MENESGEEKHKVYSKVSFVIYHFFPRNDQEDTNAKCGLHE